MTKSIFEASCHRTFDTMAGVHYLLMQGNVERLKIIFDKRILVQSD